MEIGSIMSMDSNTGITIGSTVGKALTLEIESRLGTGYLWKLSARMPER